MEYQNQRETLHEQLQAQQQALTQIYKSVEQTRKMIMWTGIFNAVMLLIPLIIFAIALPRIMSTLSSSLGALEGVSAQVDVATSGGLLESIGDLKDLGL